MHPCFSWRKKMSHEKIDPIDEFECSRRGFLKVAAGTTALGPFGFPETAAAATNGRPAALPQGPGARYIPKVRAAFVRRKGDYGMLWPGAIYDGEAALRNYSARIGKAAKDAGIQLTLRPLPIYSAAEADAWLAESQMEKPDGLLVVLLDRQEHAWPTAAKAVESKIPTVIFAPIGAAFTTNTAPLAKKAGSFIVSTDNFSQVEFGLKMIKAGAKLREMRYIVLAGNERKDLTLKHLGTKLRYLSARSFLEEYEKTAVNDEIRSIAAEYFKQATRVSGPAEQDVFNGVRSYIVARNILNREEGDGITMDCLGALGPTKVSLPCIAWSYMLDQGIPAACEADLGAALTHALVQYLFDRPGFQQDPVPDTSRELLIGAHCTCPTRLQGFSKPSEPFYLSHHHGKRDAVPRPSWRIGERTTVAILGGLEDPREPRPYMYISTGTVVENISVPPAGGCVVSVALKLDGVSDLLDYPGFHQLFFYGDYKRSLRQFCQLHDIEARVV
jgi:hypothetical protein